MGRGPSSPGFRGGSLMARFSFGCGAGRFFGPVREGCLSWHWGFGGGGTGLDWGGLVPGKHVIVFRDFPKCFRPAWGPAAGYPTEHLFFDVSLAGDRDSRGNCWPRGPFGWGGFCATRAGHSWFFLGNASGSILPSAFGNIYRNLETAGAGRRSGAGAPVTGARCRLRLLEKELFMGGGYEGGAASPTPRRGWN